MTPHVSIFQPARRARGEHASSPQRAWPPSYTYDLHPMGRTLLESLINSINYLWRSLGNVVFLLGSHSKKRSCLLYGLPRQLRGKEPTCQFRRHRFDSLGREDPLEEEKATHSSILAWEIPWTDEPGGLQCMELQRVGNRLATKQQSITYKKEKSVIMPQFPK